MSFTNTIKLTNKRSVKMIAHRGVSGLERENTCPAFVAAGVKSYYGIETDVHATKDGKYILHHDKSLLRLAGIDKNIVDCTFDELRNITLKDTDGVTERKDLFLPTPREYFSICKKYDKQAIFELKENLTSEQVYELVDCIKETGYLSRTTFISFKKELLLALRQKAPDADAQFLGAASEENIAFILENGLDGDFSHGSITQETVDTLHAHGRIVNCWTVNDAETAEKLIKMGVDFITTNILE